MSEAVQALLCARDVVFLRCIMIELGFVQPPTVINTDSSTLMDIIYGDRKGHVRSRHFLAKINYMRELVEKGEIAFRKVNTQHNVSDVLTKPLGVEKFDYFMKLCGLRNGGGN